MVSLFLALTDERGGFSPFSSLNINIYVTINKQCHSPWGGGNTPFIHLMLILVTHLPDETSRGHAVIFLVVDREAEEGAAAAIVHMHVDMIDVVDDKGQPLFFVSPRMLCGS